MTKVAVFASGTGSNAEKLITYFNQPSSTIEISLVISNSPDAKVLEKAKSSNVKTAIFSNEDFIKATPIIDYLKEEKIEWIILAGFLRKISSKIIQAFPDKIINIHPSLLPKYGGKGMYGSNVHKAVVAAKEKESGISIHIIDEEYDKGRMLFQASCVVNPSDSAEEVAKKIQILEHQHFAEVVEKAIKQFQNENKVRK